MPTAVVTMIGTNAISPLPLAIIKMLTPTKMAMNESAANALKKTIRLLFTASRILRKPNSAGLPQYSTAQPGTAF